MRRYIFAIIFVVALAACAKTDIEVPDLERGDVVSYAVETRGSDSDLSSIYQNFQLDCYYSRDGLEAQYFEDEISYRNSNWSGTKAQYWPSDGELEFFAYAPECDEVSYTQDALKYTCPSDPDEQKDLLAAYKDGVTRINCNGVVNLDFKHILSQLRFKITIEDETNVTLNHINIFYHGIDAVNTYTFSGGGSWGAAESKYTGDDEIAKMTVGKTETGSGTGIVFDFDDNGSMYILPQDIVIPSTTTGDLKNVDISEKQYISVSVNYTLNSGLGDDETNVETGKVALPAADSSKKYKPGTVYNYTLNIDGEQVALISAKIEDKLPDVMTYGNIDLAMITKSTDMPEFLNKTGWVVKHTPEYDNDGSEFAIADKHTVVGDDNCDKHENTHYLELPSTYTDANATYYTVAERVRDLLLDGVRDFVVVGAVGSSTKTGDGDLGFYGGGSSPFSLGAIMAEIKVNDNPSDTSLSKPVDAHHYRFSVDLRGATDFPTLDKIHSTSTFTDEDIKYEHALPAGYFKDVWRLDEIIMPSEIRAIGDYAFSGCERLAHVDLQNVWHVEAGGFENCTNLEVVDNGDLTRVHNNGFKNCKELTTIDLANVTNVGYSAFAECEKLTNVDLGELEVVGEHSFSGCVELTATNFNNHAFTEIPNYTFFKCKNLGVNQTVNLSAATLIGDHAFSGEWEEINSENKIRGCKFDFKGSTESTISNVAAFDALKNEPTDYKNFSQVTTIHPNAFAGCENFSGYIAFPETVIQEYKYYKNNNESDGEIATYTKLADGIFNGCSKLEGISLPKVTTLGNGCFSGCTDVRALDLSGVTTTLVQYVDFYDDEGHAIEGTPTTSTVLAELESMKPSLEVLDLRSLADIGSGWGTLSSFTALKTLYAQKLFDAAFAGATSTTLSFPITTTVGNQMFYNAANLASISLPEAKSIDFKAFYGCEALETLDIKKVESVAWKASAFYNCKSLKKLDLSGVKDDVNLEIFKGDTADPIVASNLEELIIPNATGIFNLTTEMFPKIKILDITNMTSSWGTFTSLPELEELRLKTVGGGAFAGSTITKINLSVTETLGSQAFNECANLLEVRLPELDNYEFVNYVDASTPWCDAFNGATTGNCVIYLSDAQYEKASGSADATGPTWQGHNWKTIVKASSESSGTIEYKGDALQ